MSRARVVRLRGTNSRYKPLSRVGKSLAQVGRTIDKDASIIATDSELFEKWAQCLASADELVGRCYWEKSKDPSGITFICVMPIIVVPDDRLWVVEYDTHGVRQSEPMQTDQCSLFVDKLYSMENLSGSTLHVSHIEIMTLSGLSAFVSDCLHSKEAMKTIFPDDAIYTAIEAMEKDL